MMQIMTGQLVVFVIICISSVIATVMHCHEFKKTQVSVQLVMLKEMVNQVRKSEYLAELSITEKMDTND